MEKYYLIDYENVHGNGLNGCDQLTNTDHVYLFYTANVPNIPWDIEDSHGKADINKVKVSGGKQSLDMHLVSWLGYLIGHNKDRCVYIIISKDKDYDKIINFWKEKDVSIFRQASIAVNLCYVEVYKAIIQKWKNKEQDIEESADQIASIIVGYSNEKNILREVHNKLQKDYGDFYDIYGVVKPIIEKFLIKQTKA